MVAKPEPIRVLLIDDDVEMLTFLGSIARSMGFHVRFASTYKEVVGQLQMPVDLVVVDLMMPEHDGIEIIDLLAEQNSDASLLIITGSSENICSAAENYARMRGLRVVGAHRKPVFKQDFRDMLGPLVRRGDRGADDKEFLRMLSGGKFAIHYQPIIDTQRAALHALEAVPVIFHPRTGAMATKHMWQRAEELGVAAKMRDQVVTTAIRDADELSQKGIGVTVSFRGVRDTLFSGSFTDDLLELCHRRHLLPSSVCVNVVESDVENNLVAALGALTRLAMRGVQIAVDNFGGDSWTGGLLSRIPATEIKLEDTVVRKTLGDFEARSRVSDIVAYAKGHEFAVVAKGVSSREHLGLLMDLGIKNFQGPLIREPGSFEEIVYWLKEMDHHLGDLGIKSHLRTGSKK